MPALLTSDVELAELVDGDVHRGVPLLGVGDVEVDVAGRVAELVGQRLALVVEDVADDHFGALGDEHPGVRGAHPPRPAADQCDFSVHASHDAVRLPHARLRTRTCSNSAGPHTASIRHDVNRHGHSRRTHRYRQLRQARAARS